MCCPGFRLGCPIRPRLPARSPAPSSQLKIEEASSHKPRNSAQKTRKSGIEPLQKLARMDLSDVAPRFLGVAAVDLVFAPATVVWLSVTGELGWKSACQHCIRLRSSKLG